MAMDQVGLLALAVAVMAALAALGCYFGDRLERAFFPEDAERRERTAEPRMAEYGPALRHHTRPGRRS